MKLTENIRKKIFILLLLVWPVIHWLVFTLYMNIQTIVYSFQSLNIFTGEMDFVWLDNYKSLINNIITNTDNFGTAFRNMFLWLLLNVFVIIPLALVVAYVLSKKIPLYKFYNVIFFIPNIVSIVILTMLWGFMWAPNNGIINGILDMLHLSQLKQVWLGDPRTALPVVFIYCIWAGIGWNNLILSGAIGKISDEMFEAAALDGATNFQEFIYIIIPQVWSTIVTIVIIYAAESFRVFLIPQLLTNGQYDTSSVALKVVEYVTTNGDYGTASAAGLVIAVVGFITVYTIKFFMEKLDNKWS
jgi:ABC-type sugar transport system permease subunit